jgi:hypothetical protein
VGSDEEEEQKTVRSAGKRNGRVVSKEEEIIR